MNSIMDLTIAKEGGGNSSNVRREYRKGNWTFEETMILIEAKRMDEERRMKRVEDGNERGKPGELRWKWVEDYCWKNGCLRSQNQCNDKWDNLMRDFKKVREYERRGEDQKSYWSLDKNERKDNNLPSNMLLQIYQALVEVVERKGLNQARTVVVVAAGGARNSDANTSVCSVDKSNPHCAPVDLAQQHSMAAPLILHKQKQHPIIQSLLPPLPPPQTPTEPRINFSCSQPLPTQDSDTSEHTGSPAKRRKRAGEGHVGSAISKSASMIAEAIQSNEEREERRHREVMSVEERRLQIEESKAEINREAINGLVLAINKLANSILALVSHTNQPPSAPS